MMIPGANRGINEATKEKQKANQQYNAGHSSVKSMSFVHTRCLTHCIFLGIPFGDAAIKAQWEEGVNYGKCKNSSMFTLIIVIDDDSSIYRFDRKEKTAQ